MTRDAPRTIPQSFAERFAQAYAAFVDAVRDAIAAGIPDPAIANTPMFLPWQTQALPLLEQENAAIQNGMARFLIGEEQTIIRLAADTRVLGRKLDGFDLNFAGAERGKVLDRLETAVVVAASQLCTAAGVP